MTNVETDIEGPLYAPAKKAYPQKVSGTFRRIKWAVLIFCLGVYYLLPFIRWDRGPNLPNQAVLVDFESRRFYFFFIEIWPQEVYYFTGLLVLAAMTLFLMNALAGRIWCGYLCWQTVWTDLYVAVEHFFQGDRRERMKLDEAPWTTSKVAKKAATHFVWLLIAWWTGGAWVLYFADAPTLVKDLATFQAPAVAYLWIGILTFTTYVFAGHMREQVCLYMCPWPRIQAALTDEHALNVSYRYDRGEPRMSLKEARRKVAAGEQAGDCVDCYQCVAVCPTGVDIRHGVQLGCIQCGLCIDACNNVMAKIGRQQSLIAFDSDENIRARLAGEPIHYYPIRARTILYTAIIALVGGLMVYKLATRSTAGISILHDRSPLFVTLSDGRIRNAYTLRLANKKPDTRHFALTVSGVREAGIEAVGVPPTSDWRPVISVGPDQTLEVRVLVTVPRNAVTEKSTLVSITASVVEDGETATGSDHFFAP